MVDCAALLLPHFVQLKHNTSIQNMNGNMVGDNKGVEVREEKPAGDLSIRLISHFSPHFFWAAVLPS